MKTTKLQERNDAVKTTKMACWLAGLLLTALAHAADLPSAPEVLKETSVSAGLAVVVGTIDGKLEADLTQGPLRKGLGVQDGAVAVTATEPDSPAALAGMSAGDVILGPPGDHFREPQQIREWVMTSIPGQTRELEILRGLVVRTVSVRIAAPPEHSDRGSGS